MLMRKINRPPAKGHVYERAWMEAVAEWWKWFKPKPGRRKLVTQYDRLRVGHKKMPKRA